MERVSQMVLFGSSIKRAVVCALIFAAVFTAGMLVSSPARAQVQEPFEPPRFTTNDTGDISFVGNTLMTCPAEDEDCADARNGTASGGALNNNAYQMEYVDVDSNPSTINSSRANFTLPAGGEVLWAGLYWGGRSSNAERDQALFQTPGSGGYQQINGEVIGTFGSPPAYHAFANVTDLVSQAGSGTYAVGNVQANTGTDRYAGWSLVVVYRDPSAPPRNLTVFDGFANVSNSATIDIPISGFRTPPAGDVNARLGFVAYEGDRGATGDSLSLSGGENSENGPFTTISNSLRPANNFFNSSISRFDQNVTDKQPNYVNQLGFDIGVVNADDIIPNDATEATLRLSTNLETYYPGVITTAIDLYAPDIAVNKSVTDVDGGEVRPGDILEYEIAVENSGQDSADVAEISDSIPDSTSYVADSLEVVSGPNSGAKTDAPGDDQADYDGGGDQVVFRVGEGADSTEGGTLAPGSQANNSTTVRFRVRVDEDITGEVQVSNQAIVDYRGRILDQDFTTNSSPANITIVPQPTPPQADTSVEVEAPNRVEVGENFAYTTTVSNSGPDAARKVVVRSELPRGVEFVRASKGCKYIKSNRTVACNLGNLPDGQSKKARIIVKPLKVGTVRLQSCIVRSATADPNSSNNRLGSVSGNARSTAEASPTPTTVVSKTGKDSR